MSYCNMRDMTPPSAPASVAPKSRKPWSSIAGARLREAVEAERPLQVAGGITAYAARMAHYHRYENKLDELFGEK
jgi:hypothetical protein